MASFPTFTFGSSAKYPVTRTIVCPAGVERFSNTKEQRYKAAPAYYKISFPLTNLKPADRDALATFFADQKGMFDSTWDITLDRLYEKCRFEQDELIFREDRPNRFSTTVSLTSLPYA